MTWKESLRGRQRRLFSRANGATRGDQRRHRELMVSLAWVAQRILGLEAPEPPENGVPGSGARGPGEEDGVNRTDGSKGSHGSRGSYTPDWAGGADSSISATASMPSTPDGGRPGPRKGRPKTLREVPDFDDPRLVALMEEAGFLDWKVRQLEADLAAQPAHRAPFTNGAMKEAAAALELLAKQRDRLGKALKAFHDTCRDVRAERDAYPEDEEDPEAVDEAVENIFHEALKYEVKEAVTQVCRKYGITPHPHDLLPIAYPRPPGPAVDAAGLPDNVAGVAGAEEGALRRAGRGEDGGDRTDGGVGGAGAPALGDADRDPVREPSLPADGPGGPPDRDDAGVSEGTDRPPAVPVLSPPVPERLHPVGADRGAAGRQLPGAPRRLATRRRGPGDDRGRLGRTLPGAEHGRVALDFWRP